MSRKGFAQQHAVPIGIALRTFDLLVVLAAALAAYALRFEHLVMPGPYRHATVIAVLLALYSFNRTRLYRPWRGHRLGAELRVIVAAWSTTFLVLALLAVLTQTAQVYSRSWMALWFGLGLVGLVASRLVLRGALHGLRTTGYNTRNIVCVVGGKLGARVVRHLQNEAWIGLRVIGYFDDRNGERRLRVEGVPWLGTYEELPAFLARGEADQVWIALPLSAEARVREVLHALRHATVDIRFVPDIFGFQLLNHSVEEVAGMPVINLSATPMVGVNRLVKGLEDRLLAALIVVLISPVLVAIAAGVKLSSPGPVFFRQERLGYDGRVFRVWKFRSMKLHAEAAGAVMQARRNDPRVTRFGAWLRRTSLDELPQFFNVLDGSMSIVGPRPHALAHNEQYKELIGQYMRRHKVKPGITGWAQVNGYRGETDTLEKMAKRVEYDLYYIEHWSLWLDLKIIGLTLIRGCVSANAY